LTIAECSVEDIRRLHDRGGHKIFLAPRMDAKKKEGMLDRKRSCTRSLRKNKDALMNRSCQQRLVKKKRTHDWNGQNRETGNLA